MAAGGGWRVAGGWRTIKNLRIENLNNIRAGAPVLFKSSILNHHALP
jgi:hypothetical protein